MLLPPLYGQINQTGFFIFAAADFQYFTDFGKSFVNSVLTNTDLGVHIHLYNPSDDQIYWCNSKPKVSVTYEYVPIELLNPAAQKWSTNLLDSVQISNHKRIITAMHKGKDKSLQERLQKTYFASARFIRLNQLTEPNSQVLAVDIDAIVKSCIPALTGKDFFIHRITGKNTRFLAGGIYLTGTPASKQFISQYAAQLENNILQDTIHWGVDQDVLDYIVPGFNWGQLPVSYIDWEMARDSYIWTAKGTRKDLKIFICEQLKYYNE